MKRINLDKMSRAELDRLGAAAERVTFENTVPLTADARRALTRAGKEGGARVLAPGPNGSTSQWSKPCSKRRMRMHVGMA